ncbi:porin [Bradyrhizobium sp. B117]|uniref:porin n=1 Tax=Bradyrhizobium sp. B117 TaxID=3140246 RepID=UPI003183DA56
MTIVKSILLGSVAGFTVVSGGQAADLPLKAKAVEYVKVCSLYGAGFYYVPGSDTCIKLGGYLRMDVAANTNSNSGNTSGAGGAQNRFSNGYNWRARQDLSIDTRTATAYGVLRTYGEVGFTWTDDTYAGNGTGATVYSPIGPSPYSSAPANASTGAQGYGTLGVYSVFIQFAGFTIGKAVSQFSTPWTVYPGNIFDGLVGGGGAVNGVNQLTYTAEFGNGVSAAISAQDPTQYTQAGVNNVSAGGAFGTGDYAGTLAPDIIGSVSVDQPWGFFKASVAAHDNHAAYYGATEITGHPDDKWGWAGQLALSIKNLPTGPGDSINVQAVYTDGATRFNIQEQSQATAMTIYGGTSLPGAYQSVGFGFAPDTVFAAGTQQQLTKTWGGRGAYNHNWDPFWSTSIYGAYATVSYNSTAKGLICHNATWVVPTVTSCNPDYNIAQAGIVTRWTPVKNLTFSADLTYTHLDQNMVGTISAASAAIGKPAAVYQLKNQDTVMVLFRAQRNF